MVEQEKSKNEYKYKDLQKNDQCGRDIDPDAWARAAAGV